MQTENCTTSQDTRLQGQTESCQGEEEKEGEEEEEEEDEETRTTDYLLQVSR